MRYWVYKDSRLVGPLGADEMAQVGGLRPETLVCVGEAPGEKEGDWKCAEQIPELAGSCRPDLPSAFVDAPETIAFDSLLELAESGGREDAPEVGLSFYEFLENSPIMGASSEFMGEVSRQQELLAAQAKARDLRAEVDALARRVRELEVQRNELMDRLAAAPQVQPAPLLTPPAAALPPASIAPPVVVAPEPAALPPLSVIPELPPLPVPLPGPPLPQAPEAAPPQDSRVPDMALPALEPLPPAPSAPQPADALPALTPPQTETVSAPPQQAPAADEPVSQKPLSSAFPEAPIGTAGLKFKPAKTFKKKAAQAPASPAAPLPANALPEGGRDARPPALTAQALPAPAPEGPGPLPPLPVLGAPPAAQPQAEPEESALPAAPPRGSESSALEGGSQYPEKPFSFPVAPAGPPPGAGPGSQPQTGPDSQPVSAPGAGPAPGPFNFPSLTNSPLPSSPETKPLPQPGDAPQMPFGFSREQPGPTAQPPLTLVRDAAPEAPAPFLPAMEVPQPAFPPTQALGPGSGALPWAGSSVPPPATLAYSPAASSLPVAPGPRPIPTPIPTPMPTPLEPGAMTGGRELLSRLAKPADTASTAPKPKRRRPTWIWIVACAAVLAAVVGIWVVFFQDPKDLKVMFKAGKGDVPVEPESEEAPGPDAPAAEPGGGSSPTAGPAPMADPGKDAIELAKAYPLGGGRGTILQWMQYSFPSSPGDGSKEEWTAGAMDSSTYFVQYKFTPGPGSTALKAPLEHLFEVSLAAKTVVGKNPPAKELLAGKAQPSRKPSAAKPTKSAAPKKKPKPSARPAAAEQPVPQPLPTEEDLLPPSDEGAMPAADTVE